MVCATIYEQRCYYTSNNRWIINLSVSLASNQFSCYWTIRTSWPGNRFRTFGLHFIGWPCRTVATIQWFIAIWTLGFVVDLCRFYTMFRSYDVAVAWGSVRVAVAVVSAQISRWPVSLCVRHICVPFTIRAVASKSNGHFKFIQIMMAIVPPAPTRGGMRMVINWQHLSF